MQWWEQLHTQHLRERFALSVPKHVPGGVEVAHHTNAELYAEPTELPPHLQRYPKNLLLVHGGYFVFRRHINTVALNMIPELEMHIQHDGDRLAVCLPVFSPDGTNTVASFMTDPEYKHELQSCARALPNTLISTISQDVACYIESVDIAGVPCAGINLSRLSWLRFVKLSDCDLDEIPRAIMQMPQLEQIGLSWNRITICPRRLREYWPRLVRINLNYNSISHLVVCANRPIISLHGNPVVKHCRVEEVSSFDIHAMSRTVHAAADALAIALLVVGSRYCPGYKFPRDIIKILHAGYLTQGIAKSGTAGADSSGLVSTVSYFLLHLAPLEQQKNTRTLSTRCTFCKH